MGVLLYNQTPMIERPTHDEFPEMPEPAARGKITFPVVGVGGSAGALEVFRQLLTQLPPDAGLAVVFVQHLDPTHHSLLSEILGRATTMPATDATEGMKVEANHVYVIPANVDLTLADG